MTEQEKVWFEILSKEHFKDAVTFKKPQYRGLWDRLVDMYKESAHFVYELIQNADDAKATEARFDLKTDSLVFCHNGTKRFSISDPSREEIDRAEGRLGDINSITSIGFSTKGDGNKSAPGNSIGKIGIGFKSVFVYTETPEIYDENTCFRIREKIIPELIERSDITEKKWKTVFVIPFNNPFKTAEKAVEEIGQQLRDMHNPTLFLNSLKRISYRFDENGSLKDGFYQKVQKESRTFDEDTSAEFLSLEHVCNGHAEKEALWAFSRKLESGLKYSVGFYMDEGMLKAKYEPAYCFFQTKEETHLNFIIHAPFLLTPDRQHLKDGNEHNVSMLDCLASLAADSFVYLRDIGVEKGNRLIDDGFLSLVPSRESDFCEVQREYNYTQRCYTSRITRKKTFYPFYVKILDIFKSAELFPAENSYVDANHAFWAEDSSLVNLFCSEDVSVITKQGNSQWILLAKPRTGADENHREWMGIILSNSHVLNEDYFLQRVTSAFCEEKFKSNPDWFVSFYEWLDSAKKRTESAKAKPFFINEKGEAVPAFKDDVLQIFLPTGEQNDYPTINEVLFEKEPVRNFLRKVGLKEPSLKDEIYTKIFVRDSVLISDLVVCDAMDSLFKSDFKKIFKYYESLPFGEVDEFLKDVRKKHRLICCSLEEGKYLLSYSANLYFKTDVLTKWFENDSQVHFLDIDFYKDVIGDVDKLNRFFVKLGVSYIPRAFPFEISGYSRGSLVSNLSEFGFDWDCFETYNRKILNYQVRWYSIKIDSADNLVPLLESIDLDRSQLIWNVLKENLSSYNISKMVDVGFNNSQGYYHRAWCNCTPLLKLLDKYAWIYSVDEMWMSPNEIYIEDLADVYDVSSSEALQLIQFLGITNKPVVEVPPPVYDVETQKKIDFFDKLKSAGFGNVPEEEIINILRELRRRKEQTATQEISNHSKSNKRIEHKQSVVEEIITKAESLAECPAIENDDVDNSAVDFDDYTPKSIDFDKRIQKAKDRSAAEINTIERLQYLQDVVFNSPKYSFAWFKALLEMEASASFDSNSNSRQVNVSFGKVEKSGNGHLILKHPNHYIPQHVEDLANIPVNLECADGSKIRVVFEAMSVKSFDLYVKLRNPEEVKDFDLDDVVYVNINAQSPAFLYKELLNKFKMLKDRNGNTLPDSFDLKLNLTENIKFVFGPPGTGKTTYLAKDVLIPLMKDNKKVLVLTPTNKAADVLTCRIVEQFSNEDDSYKKWLMRFGISCEEKIEKYGITQGKEFDIENVSKAVVVTTIARYAYDNFIKGEYLDDLAWDYVIIDEASMIPLVNIVYPLYKSKARFVITGDPFQIEPISSIDQWKDQNIYKMVGLNDFANVKTEPRDYEVVKLDTQYRSIPSVGEVFSRLTYGGMLKHHRLESSQRHLGVDDVIPLRPLNVIKFPVSKYEGIYRCKKLNNSHYQIYSALFTYEFVSYLSGLISQKNPTESFTIGIIAAYRPQANLVERLFAAANLPPRVKVHAGTIHGFQGDECDIIVALFNPPENISNSENMFLNKKNIVNVAISRARDYLIVVMPDDNTEKIENLELINDLETLMSNGDYADFLSNDLEEKMFDDREFLVKNAFVTTHQNVNVYGEPQYRYEIRSEENALDVQIHK